MQHRKCCTFMWVPSRLGVCASATVWNIKFKSSMGCKLIQRLLPPFKHSNHSRLSAGLVDASIDSHIAFRLPCFQLRPCSWCLWTNKYWIHTYSREYDDVIGGPVQLVSDSMKHGKEQHEFGSFTYYKRLWLFLCSFAYPQFNMYNPTT